jgi:hypothetical protein
MTSQSAEHAEVDVTDQRHGKAERHIQITTMVLESNGEEFRFKLPDTAALLEVLQHGAELAQVTLLPTKNSPLDRLHNILKRDEIGAAIEDLDQAVGEFVRRPGITKDFGIELVLAFRVNTRWAVAPKPELSPREILTLPAINLDFTQYSLYLPNSTELLPLDTPIKIERGMAFEAQRDGRYGAHHGVPAYSS